MAEITDSEPSLLRQILDEMLVRAEEQGSFDEKVLKGLRDLAASGGLASAREVTRIIASAGGDENETA